MCGFPSGTISGGASRPLDKDAIRSSKEALIETTQAASGDPPTLETARTFPRHVLRSRNTISAASAA